MVIPFFVLLIIYAIPALLFHKYALKFQYADKGIYYYLAGMIAGAILGPLLLTILSLLNQGKLNDLSFIFLIGSPTGSFFGSILSIFFWCYGVNTKLKWQLMAPIFVAIVVLSQFIGLALTPSSD